MSRRYIRRYRYGTVRIIAHTIVSVTAILSLTVYGITLAQLGIDSQIALVIGGLIGGIGGFNIKKLYDVLRQK